MPLIAVMTLAQGFLGFICICLTVINSPIVGLIGRKKLIGII